MGTWKSWVLTVDHKKIGILYGLTSLAFLFVGGATAALFRTKLLFPGEVSWMSAQTYNELFTMHGSIMVWLVIIPLLTGAFGNYLVPLMIGAKDMAFPRMNALSYWMYLLGGAVFVSSYGLGMPDDGWTSYPPYSVMSQGIGQDLWVMAIHILGISSIIGGINFIVTIITMRAPGMTFNRMPLFVWSSFATAFIQTFATPALSGAATTILLDRNFGTVFYNAKAGADPMMYQNLYWFYSHPSVYIMILPAMGIISEIIPVFSRKPIFGYSAIAYSSMAIAFLGFFVWAHHMFSAGMPLSSGIPFMVSSMIIAVPSSIKVFNWLATMHRGQIVFTVPMLFSAGFISMFVIGGLTGIFIAAVPVDLHLHDTYFIVAHFHYVVFGASLMGALGGFYYWLPKVTGRMYNETFGKTVFWLYFLGGNLTFMPMHFSGLAGMPRRYYIYAPYLQPLNEISTIGAYLTGVALILFVIQLMVTAKTGKVAGNAPWEDAHTLEWQTSSPPPEDNFASVPIVAENPYKMPSPRGPLQENPAH